MYIEEVKLEYQKLLEEISDPDLISNTQTPVKRGEERSSSSWDKGDESKDSSSPLAGARVFEELNKKKKFLEDIIEKEKEIKELESKIEEDKSIVAADEDRDLVSLAETETTQMQEKKKVLEKELNDLLEGDLKEKKTSGSVIVEIRAGTGGQEAALFAGDLYRMYSKHAASQNWQQKTLDSRPTELGGFKEITFELKDGDVFSKMKFEGGVHRVQRIPETEKSGRVHTSTASVAVLPKPKKTELKIRTDDLKVDTYRASGPGGQYVNKRETAVRITHLPTNIVVTSQTERNQLQNKESALSILSAKLLEKEEEEEASKVSGNRKAQIGKAKRAEKIRTYNFPQDRVTDHRIKKSFHNLEAVMEGKLDSITKALQKTES